VDSSDAQTYRQLGYFKGHRVSSGTQHASAVPGFVLWESPRAREIAVRIAIAGDFLPAGRLYFSANGTWRDQAAGVAPTFRDISASFVNLEAVLDPANLTAQRLCGLGDIVSASPNCLDYLDALHARFIGIANNHIYDFGSPGVSRTREAIEKWGATALGAGRDLRAEPEIAIWQGPGGITVGFWAAARATRDPATTSSVGVEPATTARALRALHLMKQRGAQCTVALLHAGCLRTSYPDPEDVQLMDRVAENGFDLVAASHSHRISGAKQLRSKQGRPAFCFYGLGSLVSGYAAQAAEHEGLIVVAALDAERSLAKIEIRPVLLVDSGFGEIPPASASQQTLSRFVRLSAEIEDGSYKDAFYREVSRGLFRLYVRDARRAFQQHGVRGLAQKASRLRMRHMRRLVHKVTG
jgi:hypothetical protein